MLQHVTASCNPFGAYLGLQAAGVTWGFWAIFGHLAASMGFLKLLKLYIYIHMYFMYKYWS